MVDSFGARGWRAPVLACLLAGSALPASPAQAETALAEVSFDLHEPAGDSESIDLTVPEIQSPLLAEMSIQSAVTASEAEVEDPVTDELRLSFGDHVRAIKTELAVAFAYTTAVNVAKLAARENFRSFGLKDEGLFGKDTRELGMDKLVHAHNTYVMSEILGARIRRNTGTTRGTALSGAILASGLNVYSEIYDGFKGGFGLYDLAFNSMGAVFSVIRHTTPGLEEKLDFRVLIMPNRQIYSPTGEEHYRQLRYLFALELAGFKGLEKTPLRFVELHAGYYGKGFTDREEDRGEPRERKLFAGVGINLNELLFKRSPKTKAARAASQVLDYWQPPYTYVHAD